MVAYSPKCVEGVFCEVRIHGVLRTSEVRYSWQAMEEWVRKLVRAKAYFLSPEEGGRSRDVDLRNPQSRYEMLADFRLGFTEPGHKRYCAAEVAREDGPGYIELGVEQTVLVGLYCRA